MCSTSTQYHVFISYSHVDIVFAKMLKQRLSKVGFYPWVDFDGIVGGDAWKQAIEAALAGSTACLVLLTPESVASEWVHYEINRAQECACPIIPLMVRECPLPEKLQALHYIDFRRDFDAPFEEVQRALMSAIMRRNARPRQPQPAPKQTKTGPLALVVEDVDNFQEMLRDLLEDMGLDVHVAGTRNTATSLLRSHEYDFITLDMQLGPDDVLGQEGVYLLDLLKRYQEGVPVVMITHLDWNRAKVRDFFRKHGIKDMLDKPFDHGELRDLVYEYVPGLERG